MELITRDRPGLLSAVGHAFATCGVRLQNARIATFGSRAEDAFYITDTDNQPLQQPRKDALAHLLGNLNNTDTDVQQ
ncbi:MAG: hypothetical protein MZV65_16815 [Chromatiales bacterium]|nr:hypothetical protein [Chromatiales bacterium]